MDTRLLVKQFIGTAGVQLTAKALAVLTGIVYARYLGPEEYGIYGYVISIITLLTLPAIAGLHDLLIREVANYQLGNKLTYISGIISWSRNYVIIVSFIVVILTFLSMNMNIFKSSIIVLMSIALFQIPIRGLMSQQSAILNGLRKPILSQVPMGIISPLIILLILFISIINQKQITNIFIIKITIFSSIIALILSAFWIGKYNGVKDNKNVKHFDLKSWHKSLCPFALMSIISTLNSELATVFIGWLDKPESIAYFKVAMQGTLLISLGLNATNTIIMPRIARLYKNKHADNIQQLLTNSVRLNVIILLPIIFTLLAYGDVLINVLFGKEYAAAYPIMIVLCVGQIVNVSMGSVGIVLTMTHNEKYCLRALLLTLIITVILLSILIPLYSSLGAAYAISASVVIWNVVMSFYVYKLTGLKAYIR
ncbi:flippase [Moritella sp. 36]|uniref:flippase n=1 Tax=Moritella sp. 36 TaxID=2746233 RepID=UPI001BAB6EEC|nr:flippase [Moritella sp. 36]QUM87883.1 flippase [Moritella sp. 36]